MAGIDAQLGWRRQAPIWLIMAAVLVTFGPLVGADFVSWDDSETVARNPRMNPAIFHAANVLVHLATALVVNRILRMLARSDWSAAVGAYAMSRARGRRVYGAGAFGASRRGR